MDLAWHGKPIEHCNKYELQAMIQHQAGIIEKLSSERPPAPIYVAAPEMKLPNGWIWRAVPANISWWALGVWAMCGALAVMWALLYSGVIP